MNELLSNYFEGIKGKRIGFIGFGVSHKNLVELFAKKGVKVFVMDKSSRGFFEESGVDIERYESLGIKFIFGGDYLAQLSNMDIVFRSPGFNFNNDELKKARKAGAIITGEMDEFVRRCPCKIIGITGSDGKTTTTNIIKRLVEKTDKKIWFGGNMGIPLFYQIEEISEDDLAVLELSSYQLISMKSSPNVSVVTNLTPNHLDIHIDLDEYISAKTNIFKYQKTGDKLIVNLDNDVTAGFKGSASFDVAGFSRKTSDMSDGAFVDGDGDIYRVSDNEKEFIMNASEIYIPGDHNVENYLAAISATAGLVTKDDIVDVARTFAGVEHRIEFVLEADGIKYYNDSISTTPTRTIAALKSFKKNIILIVGGSEKFIPFDPMMPLITKRVKKLITLGITAPKIEAALESYKGYKGDNPPVVRVNSLADAVNVAKDTAKSGDTVLLSPACASFDMFKNFADRGLQYKEIVRGLYE